MPKPRKLNNGLIMTGKIYADGAKITSVKRQRIDVVIKQLQELQDKYE